MTAAATARLLVLTLIPLTTLACTAAAGPYVAKPGTEPTVPVEEARQRCEKQAGFQTMNGSRQMDWGALQRCMDELGWIPDSGGGGR